MNRRELLAGLSAGAAGALIVPSRSIFLPPRGGWRPWESSAWAADVYSKSGYADCIFGPGKLYVSQDIGALGLEPTFIGEVTEISFDFTVRCR